MASTGDPDMLPHNRTINLRNTKCVYCSGVFLRGESTKEHVIGRRFVPKGALNAQWNLIANACQKCNVNKSWLEDDISAITLLSAPDPLRGNQAMTGSQAIVLPNKTRSISRKTGKRVIDSYEETDLKFGLDQKVTMRFGFVAAPQIESKRAFLLARFHITGFFYWLTYDEAAQHGRYIPGVYRPVLMTGRSDWGNPVNLAFSSLVQGWQPRIAGITAQGYFKVAIRKHPDALLWSWALEWNQSVRVIGFWGDGAVVDELIATLPELKFFEYWAGGERTRYREEVPLNDSADTMFAWSGKSP